MNVVQLGIDAAYAVSRMDECGMDSLTWISVERPMHGQQISVYGT